MFVLETCTYEDTEKQKEYIELYHQRFKYKVRYKDIKYIEAYNGYSEFVVGNKRFRREESLKEIEQLIDMSMFVRIQRGYIVNLRHIKSYENMVVKIGDVSLPVSRRRRRNFEESYTYYHIITSEKM